MPVPDQTTPYGRACNQCVKAKAKCSLRGHGSACDRCTRLKKDCQTAVGARRKPGRKPGSARTDALEARLDGLMTLLGTVPGLQQSESETQQSQQSQPERPRRPLSVAQTKRTHNSNEIYTQPTQDEGRRDQTFEGSIAFHGSTVLEDTSPAAASLPPPSPFPYSASSAAHSTIFPGLTAADAEDALNCFRLHKVKYLPFVHIPHTRTTAARLQQTHPLLWLSIMACSTRSADLQKRLSLRLRQQIADQAVVQHQRSVDLLLGIVGFLAWGMYYLKRDPFLFMYCHMATAVVQDLGLDREPPARGPSSTPASGPGSGPASGSGPTPAPTSTSAATPSSTYIPSAADTPEPHPLSTVRAHGFAIKVLTSPVRSMEERRAVLGTYFVTVLVSLFHRKMVALPWTDHMDECLRVLDAHPETPLDRLLVYQCRLHRVALDIPGLQAYSSITSASEMRLVRDFQVRAILQRQRDVEAACPSLPDDLLHICRAANIANEAAIYSVALYATHPSPDEHLRCGPDVARAELLARCLHLHRQYFDMVVAAPKDGAATTSFFHMFSLQMVTQLSHLLISIYRLATFGRDDPACGWDKAWARAQLDVPGMVDAIAQRFSEAAGHMDDATMAAAAAGTGIDFFSRAARALGQLRVTWMGTWAKEEQQQQQQQQQQQDQGQEWHGSEYYGEAQPGLAAQMGLTPDSAAANMPLEPQTMFSDEYGSAGGMNLWFNEMLATDWI